ncbi:Uncharacterized protein GBIM_13332 [Gryllus bimaculatus]|nr:Uncharacterized protein GBIM_13332 [Gryllus bimaculatus]
MDKDTVTSVGQTDDYTSVCQKKKSQHKKTSMHQANYEKKDSQKQTLLTQSMSSKIASMFYFDMCKAFTAANIPWNVVENTTMRSLLEKYCKETIRSESTLRKYYLAMVYESQLKRSEIGDSYILISVDETTDARGRRISNIIEGK